MTPLATPDRITVWRIELSTVDPVRADALLSVAERARADRFVHHHDRAAYAAAHATLRRILSRASGIAAPDLRFSIGPTGKPSLAGMNEVQFNLSHSDGLALVALAPARAVGVDVERRRTSAPDLGAGVFSDQERAAIAQAANPTAAFYDAWTRKEALLKATGAGLSTPALHAIDTSDIATPISGYHVCPLDCGSDYSAAVAIEAIAGTPTPEIVVRDWLDAHAE